jgi:hypothetical protein
VGAGDAGDDAILSGGRHPERVALALDDERRDGHGLELRQAALLRTAGRMKREREAQHGRRLRLGRRAAGHAGA